MNKDYGRHVHRTWVDTHTQSIRTDPEIYLPGEVDTKDDAGDSDSDNDDDDDDDDNEDDGEDDGEPPKILSGRKRKATTRTRSSFPTKVAKTKTRAGPSTAALGVIDDRRPDLALIDIPIGEGVPTRPYGRHGCLYMEMKVDANKKPNPQEVVSRLFLRFPYC
jgi:hypothetical protein